jgi:hypothetical protein
VVGYPNAPDRGVVEDQPQEGQVWVRWNEGQGRGFNAFSATTGRRLRVSEPCGEWETLTRISHAPTPEPARLITKDQEGHWAHDFEKADLDAQKADLLEEVDRVNPRLMQATDEQIEDERERRANFPERRIASIKKEMLARYGEAWFKMMLKDFENQVRIHTRECILAEQEGGSHE